MADRVRVNFNSLATAGADLSAGVASAGTRLENLKGAIAPMVATWDGDAQIAYHEQQTKWDTAWVDLTDALKQLQIATMTSHDGFQAGESSNTSSWG
ncbi:MAG: WXG100 family type VII secretion target [Janthinobacterium lividum]